MQHTHPLCANESGESCCVSTGAAAIINNRHPVPNFKVCDSFVDIWKKEVPDGHDNRHKAEGKI